MSADVAVAVADAADAAAAAAVWMCFYLLLFLCVFVAAAVIAKSRTFLRSPMRLFDDIIPTESAEPY